MAPTPTQRFAAELDRLRRRNGLSFRDLSRRTGRPVSTLNNALTGRVLPRLDTVLAVVRACGDEEKLWRSRYLGLTEPESNGADDAGAPVAPRELPHTPRAFVGRDAELSFLTRLVDEQAEGGVVIVAVHGMPGVGKTGFAVRAAHQLQDRFPDGQVFLDLGGHRGVDGPVTASEAMPKLLRAFGVPDHTVPIALDEQVRLYRTVLDGRRVLILLDDAVDTGQIRPLVPGAAGSLMLVTTRHRLDGVLALDGAHALPLDALSPHQANDVLTHVLGAARVSAEPEAVAELARECGYLPLALRIAAANLSTRPRQRISDAVRELVHDRWAGLRLRHDQHVAVGTAFEHSYRTLPEDVRRLFRRSGMLPCPYLTADVVGAVSGTTPAEAARRLEHLADRCLVEERGTARYVMHDLVRAYAADRAREEERDAEQVAAERLLEWYRHTVDLAVGFLAPRAVRLPLGGPQAGDTAGHRVLRDRDEALTWLDAELPNLRALVEWAAGRQPRPAVWQLADALRSYFVLRLHISDWIAIAEAGQRVAEELRDTPAQAAMQHSLGLAYSRRGDNLAARRHFHRALSYHRTIDWPQGRVAVLVCLGGVCFQYGHLEQAARILGEASQLARRYGLERQEVAAMGDLGEVYRDLGSLRRARELQTMTAERSRVLGEFRGEAVARANLGYVHLEEGDLAGARRHLAEACRQFTALGSRDGEVYARVGLVRVSRCEGWVADAADQADRVVADADALGDDSLIVEARVARADVLYALGRFAAAADEATRVCRIASRNGYRRGLAAGTLVLASCQAALRQSAAARASCQRALRLSQNQGYRLVTAHALAVLAEIEQADGCPEVARGYASEALTGYRDAGCGTGEVRALRLASMMPTPEGVPVLAMRRAARRS